MNIVLIEPDATLGETIVEYGKTRNITVRHARSAQTALHMADSVKPDSIILELALPAHNGIEFLQELSSYSDWTDIPVIIYSHVAIEDTGLTLAGWQKYGVASYCYKPRTRLDGLFAAAEEAAASYAAA
jgi:DNA-binding response OmpR family regulator